MDAIGNEFVLQQRPWIGLLAELPIGINYVCDIQLCYGGR